VDGGDQRVAPSADSALPRTRDVATAHSPDACTKAPFSEIFNLYFRRYLMTNTPLTDAFSIRGPGMRKAVGRQSRPLSRAATAVAFRVCVRDPKSPRRRTANGHQGCGGWRHRGCAAAVNLANRLRPNATLHRPPVGLLRSNASRRGQPELAPRNTLGLSIATTVMPYEARCTPSLGSPDRGVAGQCVDDRLVLERGDVSRLGGVRRRAVSVAWAGDLRSADRVPAANLAPEGWRKADEISCWAVPSART
jgi:hypothetical protein